MQYELQLRKKSEHQPKMKHGRQKSEQYQFGIFKPHTNRAYVWNYNRYYGCCRNRREGQTSLKIITNVERHTHHHIPDVTRTLYQTLGHHKKAETQNVYKNTLRPLS
jgi:hypothetical protein